LRQHGRDTGFVVEPNPAHADVIILWEGFEGKTPSYIETLERDPLIRQHSERVYAINYQDHPEGLLAGIYTSLEHPFFDSEIHRIWPFFIMNNQQVYGLTRDEVLTWNPKLLFSFTGAPSHEVRKRLFKLYSNAFPQYRVERVYKWYNHNDGDRQRFLKVALDSTFCVCPHGYCSYTPRITEVMAMARVPVIIADDWIPISFEEKLPYYIKVLEKDIEHLPEILSQYRKEGEELGRNARMLWEKYCSLERRAAAAVECIAKLAAQSRGRMSYADYRERWHSRDFLKKAGWTARQQLALRIEQHVRRHFPKAKIPGVSDLMRYRNRGLDPDLVKPAENESS
jgi:hypothetical protein